MADLQGQGMTRERVAADAHARVVVAIRNECLPLEDRIRAIELHGRAVANLWVQQDGFDALREVREMADKARASIGRASGQYRRRARENCLRACREFGIASQ